MASSRRIEGPVVAEDGTGACGTTATDDFLDGDAPVTVHPSLWRQSRLVAIDGLFEVAEGIYQVRGMDLSNTTIVEGDEGVIVFDTLLSVETGAAALALYRKHRGDRSVKAVVITHSHADHFGGIKGFVSQEEVDSGDVRIFAPEGFLEHAVSENVYAGTAMNRRAAYMYGAALTRGAHGGGRCRARPGDLDRDGVAHGTHRHRHHDRPRTDRRRCPDGLPDGPRHRGALGDAGLPPRLQGVVHGRGRHDNLHNLLTLRGAVVRDPHGWSKYLTETIDLFGDEVEVVFASHHWPTWGNDRVVEFLASQRDLYGYLHDQTVRMLNQGMVGPEIAEEIVLPPALEQTWSSRGYYGSVSHNVKAIYQRYLGWFDGNPAHLWEHTPVEKAKRYVDVIGGADAGRRQGAGRVRRRRLPLGRRAAQPRGLRAARPRRRPGPARRHLRTARLRLGERHLARLVAAACQPRIRFGIGPGGSAASWARRSFAAATICIALVIFRVDLTLPILFLSP